MYGMIHRAILELAAESLDASAPNPLAELNRSNPGLFISGSTHDDQATLELVQQAAAAMDMALPDFLRTFGEYWIRFADRGAYSMLMKVGGSNLPEFIGNLDRMHIAVREALPDASTPRFRLAAQEEGRLTVVYDSIREGLEPFVTGLLYGLLRRFGHEDGHVEQLPKDADGHVPFVLHLAAPAAA